MAAPFDPGRTALLVMDCQRWIIEGYSPSPQSYLAKSAALLAKAHAARFRVIYVKVGFRRGYPEVSDSNSTFAGVRSANLFLREATGFEIPADIAPRDG